MRPAMMILGVLVLFGCGAGAPSPGDSAEVEAMISGVIAACAGAISEASR